MPFGLGASELLIILAIVLVLFGAGKIPQLGRGLGEGIRNFKRGLKSDDEAARLPDTSNTPNATSDANRPA